MRVNESGENYVCTNPAAARAMRVRRQVGIRCAAVDAGEPGHGARRTKRAGTDANEANHARRRTNRVHRSYRRVEYGVGVVESSHRTV